MNGVKTFRKELKPNGSRKEYHSSHGFATEMYGGAGPDAQYAGVAVCTAHGGGSSRNCWRGKERARPVPWRLPPPRQLDTRIGTMYLMEYAEDWPVSRAYLNPKSIQALLLNAA
jgi:hypothetical protein